MTTDGAPAARPPDRPPAPRARVSRGAVALGALGGAVVLSYTLIALLGYEPFTPQRSEVPATVRASPGGYRTFHFWHSGYHGGK
jgi:hypothetical protein